MAHLGTPFTTNAMWSSYKTFSLNLRKSYVHYKIFPKFEDIFRWPRGLCNSKVKYFYNRAQNQTSGLLCSYCFIHWVKIYYNSLFNIQTFISITSITVWADILLMYKIYLEFREKQEGDFPDRIQIRCARQIHWVHSLNITLSFISRGLKCEILKCFAERI